MLSRWYLLLRRIVQQIKTDAIRYFVSKADFSANPKQSASSPLFTMLGLFVKLKLFRHRNLLVRIIPRYIKLNERTNGAGARGIHGDTSDETVLCSSKEHHAI